MILLSTTGAFHYFDMIFQLVSFVILLAIVSGIIAMVIGYKNRGRRLSRVEEKLDYLLNKQDKG